MRMPVLFFICAIGWCSTVFSQNANIAKLLASDETDFALFGLSVSTAGPYIISADVNESVYVFKHENGSWIEKTVLKISDAPASYHQDMKVAMTETHVIVGAPWKKAAYIFNRIDDDWSQQSELIGDSYAFGQAVAISGDYALVGAPYDVEAAINAGAVYVFHLEGDSWVEKQELLASDGLENDAFGAYVAISDEFAFIGSFRAVNSDTGQVYVFRRTESDEWVEHARIRSSDTGSQDSFGARVAASGEFVIADAFHAAFIFKNSGNAWIQQAKLSAIDGADEFGQAIAVTNQYAAVGAYRGIHDEKISGTAYFFQREETDWTFVAKVVPQDAQENDRFGDAVAMSDSFAVIGSPQNDENGPGAGAVYVIDLSLPVPKAKYSPKRDNLIPDHSQNKNFAKYTVCNLKSIFSDEDTPELSFAAETDGNTIAVINSTHLELSSVEDFVGDSQIIITARDEQPVSASDTFWVSVNEVRPVPQGLVEYKLSTSDGASSDNFGDRVAISGQHAIVSALNRRENNSRQVYIFRFENGEWNEEAKLSEKDIPEAGAFGRALAIEGDIAVVSSHIFRNTVSGWQYETSLVATEDSASVNLGLAAAISGDYIIVTAQKSAYIFKFENESWVEQAMFEGNDYSYGSSVAIQGDRAIVGAYFEDTNTPNAGAVYVYKREGSAWHEEARLVASEGHSVSVFGGSVAISDHDVLVGASRYEINDSLMGAVYVFQLQDTTWIEKTILFPPDDAIYSRFGGSIAVENDRAVIGAPFENINANRTGSLYIFQRNGSDWGEQARIVASDGAFEDFLGMSVSISGDYVIASAPGDDDKGYNSGSAYIFNSDYTTGLNDFGRAVPQNIVLEQNYPNPFNPATRISYKLAKAGNIKLSVFNQLGQKVRTLLNAKQAPGTYEVSWFGEDEFGRQVASGIYFCQLKTDDFVKTIKMVLLH